VGAVFFHGVKYPKSTQKSKLKKQKKTAFSGQRVAFRGKKEIKEQKYKSKMGIMGAEPRPEDEAKCC